MMRIGGHRGSALTNPDMDYNASGTEPAKKPSEDAPEVIDIGYLSLPFEIQQELEKEYALREETKSEQEAE